MPITIRTRRFPRPPIIPDFGWTFGTLQREPEYTYTAMNALGTTVNYPPGHNALSGPLTLPAAGTTFTVAVNATASFEGAMTPPDILVINDGNQHVEVRYAGLTATSFTGCTSTSSGNAFLANTPIWAKRQYVDSVPLHQNITFDATDSNGLGLPKTYVPAGVVVAAYIWDFANGQVGSGAFATTTYPYPLPPPSMQTKLIVIDTFGREFSTAKRLNILTGP